MVCFVFLSFVVIMKDYIYFRCRSLCNQKFSDFICGMRVRACVCVRKKECTVFYCDLITKYKISSPIVVTYS